MLAMLLISLVAFASLRNSVQVRAAASKTEESATQDPKQAAYYRRSAAAYRKQAERTSGSQRDCYYAWANYYDCKAEQLETNSRKQCVPPTCRPGA